MNTSIRIFGMALAGLLSVCAHAQSVTDSGLQLYGRIDASINVQNFSGGAPASVSGTRTAISSDTSYWGMRGTEQLGGGMSTYFKLESGFSVNNGALGSTTAFFNREAYLGFADAKYGAIEFGAHWDPSIWLTGKVDPFGRAQLGTIFTLFQGSAARGYGVQFANSVKYKTPNFNGLSGSVLASVPGGQALGSNQAFAVDYAHGPLYIGMEYDNVSVAGSSVGLPHVGNAGSRTIAAGATYRFPFLQVFGYVQNNHVDGLPGVSGYMGGISVPVTPFTSIRASISHTTNPGAQATLAALGYDYLLSKSTQVYAVVAHLNNNGRATFGMWPSSQTFGVSAPGQDITGFQVGMRHMF